MNIKRTINKLSQSKKDAYYNITRELKKLGYNDVKPLHEVINSRDDVKPADLYNNEYKKMQKTLSQLRIKRDKETLKEFTSRENYNKILKDKGYKEGREYYNKEKAKKERALYKKINDYNVKFIPNKDKSVKYHRDALTYLKSIKRPNQDQLKAIEKHEKKIEKIKLDNQIKKTVADNKAIVKNDFHISITRAELKEYNKLQRKANKIVRDNFNNLLKDIKNNEKKLSKLLAKREKTVFDGTLESNIYTVEKELLKLKQLRDMITGDTPGNLSEELDTDIAPKKSLSNPTTLDFEDISSSRLFTNKINSFKEIINSSSDKENKYGYIKTSLIEDYKKIAHIFTTEKLNGVAGTTELFNKMVNLGINNPIAFNVFYSKNIDFIREFYEHLKHDILSDKAKETRVKEFMDELSRVEQIVEGYYK